MHIQSGTIIQATACMPSTDYFADTTIWIAFHNQHDVWGYILHQPFNRPLNELVEFNNYPPYPIWVGGPVATHQLFVIYEADYPLHINDQQLTTSCFQTSDIHHVLRTLSPEKFIIMLGYCGWDTSDLNKEIQDGFWSVKSVSTSIFVR